MTQTMTTVEGDPFCRCGRNLHGQSVVRDDRTGVPMAQCPECGAFHAAGAADTAVTQWAARFYAAVVLAWALVLANIAAAAILVQTFCNGIAAEEMFFPSSGVYDANFSSGGPDDSRLFWQAMFLLVPLGLGAFLGLLQAVAMWHVRGPARLIPIVFVLAAAALMTALGLYDSYAYRQSGDYALARSIVAGVSAVTFLGWLAMLFLGRPIARAFAAVAVPPAPRRALAFLWAADGKTLPEVDTDSTD